MRDRLRDHLIGETLDAKRFAFGWFPRLTPVAEYRPAKDWGVRPLDPPPPGSATRLLQLICYILLRRMPRRASRPRALRTGSVYQLEHPARREARPLLILNLF